MALFEIETTTDDVELVADRCWQSGATGIWESANESGRVSLRVGVDDDARSDFASSLGDLDPVDVTERDDVELASRATSLSPAGIGTITLTVPPTVFGDGSHPTTAACVAVLAEVVRAGDRVLDVGCGTGALSIAAARRGATVTAVDLDADAVEATLENAAANGVRVTASTTPLAEVTDTYDVVVANISAGTIVELGGELRRLTRPDGALVLSGVLGDRWREVRAAVGGSVMSTETTDGWLTAVVRIG